MSEDVVHGPDYNTETVYSTEELQRRRTAEREARQAPRGRTISDMIGEEIGKAWITFERNNVPWKIGPDPDYAEDDWDNALKITRRASTSRGRVLGLAQALAVIRLAPNTPTAEQIKNIAEEFKP